jgi:hypothetical protein
MQNPKGPGQFLQLRARRLRAARAYGVFRLRSSLRLPCIPKPSVLRGFRIVPGTLTPAGNLSLNHYIADYLLPKMKRIVLSFFPLLFWMSSGGSAAQQVIVGDTTLGVEPSAILQLADTSHGFLLPRLSTAQRNAINNPGEGLQIYNITEKCIQAYFLTGWRNVACECTAGPAAPSSLSGPSAVCPGDTGITFQVASQPDAQSYIWSFPPGVQIVSGAGTSQVQVNFGNQGGIVSVQAQNSCGVSVAINSTIQVSLPDSTFTISPNPTGTNANTTFSATYTQPGAVYSWIFQGGVPATSTSASPVVQWAQSGQYAVTFTVTNASGCISGSSNVVSVSSCFPYGQSSQTFSYTGSVQTFTVPAGICSLRVECWGAQGGDPNTGRAGRGGYASGYLTVTSGQVLHIYVGGAGTTTSGGWNGGGGPGGGTSEFGGGGGASDVRINGTTLMDRIIVAGGGGGAGSTCPTSSTTFGGDGGGLVGGDPSGSCNTGAQPTPGTQSAGGQPGGYTCNLSCTAGGFGFGGQAGGSCGCGATGGGGGGWYGGGGSCHCKAGAGGSSYIGGMTNGTTTTGGRSGHGQVVITY